ncbi:MAG: endonuclease domain-containing protein [Terriglobia bacterium]
MEPYLADFCCRERRLIVELDGSVHGQPSQASRDALRDAGLKARGYTVL